jgi:uncharacterized membrane protein YcjF (UPF0283 family)
MKKYTKWTYYLIAVGLFTLFLLMLTSSVLDVGDRLYQLHPYVSYGFYGLVIVLVYMLILRPLHIIIIAQTFNIQTSLDVGKNKRIIKQSAQRMIKSTYISDEDKDMLKASMKDVQALIEVMTKLYQGPVKKEMMRIIKEHAKTVMISTAISQNGRLDFFTVIIVNLKMIKELVVVSGYRPGLSTLAKLSIQVMSTALVAEGLENMDISDVLPQQTLQSIAEIPLIKPILSSTTQGISNALLTLRIGIVTREYLFTSSQGLTKPAIRKTALLEAAALTPGVVADGLSILPKKVMNIFKTTKPM